MRRLFSANDAAQLHATLINSGLFGDDDNVSLNALYVTLEQALGLTDTINTFVAPEAMIVFFWRAHQELFQYPDQLNCVISDNENFNEARRQIFFSKFQNILLERLKQGGEIKNILKEVCDETTVQIFASFDVTDHIQSVSILANAGKLSRSFARSIEDPLNQIYMYREDYLQFLYNWAAKLKCLIAVADVLISNAPFAICSAYLPHANAGAAQQQVFTPQTINASVAEFCQLLPQLNPMLFNINFEAVQQSVNQLVVEFKMARGAGLLTQGLKRHLMQEVSRALNDFFDCDHLAIPSELQPSVAINRKITSV